MADLPTTAEIFAFAIFFVPGYLSLNIGSYLVKGKILNLPWLEKVVVSYVWSLLIFLSAFSILGIPLSALTVTTSLTSVQGLLLLGLAIGFGFVAAFLYILGRVMLHEAPRVARGFGLRIGLGKLLEWLAEFYSGSTTDFFLNLIWRTRVKNWVVVETQSGRILKGSLGSISIEPSLDILLYGALQEFVGGRWVDLEGWSILIPQDNIRTISAISA